MKSKLYFILRFIKSVLANKNTDFKTSLQMNNVSKQCISLLKYTERADINLDYFHDCVSKIIGVYSMIISYHESISFLCLSGHSLNASVLLRSQLEAHLIFCYLTAFDLDMNVVEYRVKEYEDWICIRMYQNSKKSKGFELFTVNPTHDEYLKEVEVNYFSVKEKYADNPEKFKELEKSQSFLKDKKTIARENEIEELYLAVFAETSATVHMADLSDRMFREIKDDFDGYTYSFNSRSESMMMVGIANIILLQSIIRYFDFLKINNEIRKEILQKIKIAKDAIKSL